MNDLAFTPRRDTRKAPGRSIPSGAAPLPGDQASGGATADPHGQAGSTKSAAATPWVISTYFAEGLPWSIVHQVSAEMFTAMGASLQAIGLTALYGVSWNAKGLWSPILDMYSTTRRWLIAAELALVLAVGSIAWFAGTNDLGSIAVALAFVAFLGATQDIAIDGFYMRALDKDRQASFSGVRVGAYRAALVVGKGLLVLIAGLTSWRVCFLAASGILLALAGLHALILPEELRRSDRESGGEGAAANQRGLSFGRAYSTFFAQPKIVWTISFILLYRAGDALMFAMSTPLLKSLGMDTAARAMLSGIVGTVISVAGSMLGGALIGRYGLARTLKPIAVAQSLAILLYVWLAWAKPGLVGIAAIVLVEQLVAGVGTAALMVFLMRRSAGEYKTSHFAIASSLMSVGMTALGSVSGVLAASVGFTAFFALAFAVSVPGVLVSFKVPTE